MTVPGFPPVSPPVSPLLRCRAANAAAIGPEVLTFLDHYLRLIGSRFMDDPELDELCKRIYLNHRQALDLIFERCGNESPLLAALEELIKGDGGRWHIFTRTSRRVDFVPASWLEEMPPLGSSRHRKNLRFWFTWYFDIDTRACRLFGVVSPCKSVEARRGVIKCLVADPNEFELKSAKKELTDSWTRLYSKTISKWAEGAEPDESKSVAVAKKTLDRVYPLMCRVPAAINSIVGRQ